MAKRFVIFFELSGASPEIAVSFSGSHRRIGVGKWREG
jgi:hypothetical protein